MEANVKKAEMRKSGQIIEKKLIDQIGSK